MRNQKLNEVIRKKAVKAGSLMMAALLVVGSGTWYYNSRNQVPELTTFVDAEGTIGIEEEEVPLAAPKVTKKTSTKKQTKKIKLKKASKKTYKKTGKAKTKKKTSTKKSSKQVTKTETVTTTKVTDQYKKGSKVDTQVTVIKETVTKTVTPLSSAAPKQASTTTVVTQKTTATQNKTAAVQSGNVSIAQAAPMVNSNVSSAFQKLGFKIVVNPSVSYSGLCDTRTRTITLRKADDTVYHELGHFVAFVAGNVDTSAAFRDVYNREKSLYTANNKAYVLSDSSEYFAESFRNYTTNPQQLKASRPLTYAAIESAVSKITDRQTSMILSVYGSVWNR